MNKKQTIFTTVESASGRPHLAAGSSKGGKFIDKTEVMWFFKSVERLTIRII
ncbi:MAG: hypothetical protein L0Y76_12120 [Ignavibacteria bacterium]|nr:hypothetical protein [Ignavibacteria bacterium]